MSAFAGQVKGLGMMQSFISIEHAVPPGSKVLEQKYCENCTATFTRPRPAEHRTVNVDGGRFCGKLYESNFAPGTVKKDIGQRYCPRCRTNMLLPVDDQDYREQLPREAEMKHSHHLPKYDESIKRNYHRVYRKRISYGDWIFRLLQANQQGPINYSQMLEITGMKTAGNVHSNLKYHGFQLVIVGHVFPRKSCMGPAPRIYNIIAVVGNNWH